MSGWLFPPHELDHKPLHRILDFHGNVPNAIRCRTDIQKDFGFMEPALPRAIVVNNIADLFSCARSPHNPVMAVKRNTKTGTSVRLYIKTESRSPYMKYDGNIRFNC
jgi:hypothetical protein